MNTFIASTMRRIVNGTIMNNYRNGFDRRYIRTLMSRFNKIIMNNFIGRDTDTIRNLLEDRDDNVEKLALFNEKVLTDL